MKEPEIIEETKRNERFKPRYTFDDGSDEDSVPDSVNSYSELGYLNRLYDSDSSEDSIPIKRKRKKKLTKRQESIILKRNKTTTRKRKINVTSVSTQTESINEEAANSSDESESDSIAADIKRIIENISTDSDASASPDDDVAISSKDLADDFFKGLYLSRTCKSAPSDHGFGSDPGDSPRSIESLTKNSESSGFISDRSLETITEEDTEALDGDDGEVLTVTEGTQALDAQGGEVLGVTEGIQALGADYSETLEADNVSEVLKVGDGEALSPETVKTVISPRKRKIAPPFKNCINIGSDDDAVALNGSSESGEDDMFNCDCSIDMPHMPELSIDVEATPCKYPIINKESIRDKYKARRLSADKSEVPQVTPPVNETLNNSAAVANNEIEVRPIWNPTVSTSTQPVWRPFDVDFNADKRNQPPSSVETPEHSTQVSINNSETTMAHQNRVPMLPIEHSINMLRPPELLTPPLTPKLSYKKQMLQLHQQQLAAAQTQDEQAPVPEQVKNNRRATSAGSRKRNASERDRPSILERVPQVAPEEFMPEIPKENETVRQRLRLHGAQTITLGPKSPLVRDELLHSKRTRNDIPSSIVTPPAEPFTIAEPLLHNPPAQPVITTEPIIHNPVNSYLNNVEPISDDETTQITPVTLMTVPEETRLNCQAVRRTDIVVAQPPMYIWDQIWKEDEKNVPLLAFQERMQDKLHLMYRDMVRRIIIGPYVPHCPEGKSLEERIWYASLLQRVGYKKREEAAFIEGAQDLLKHLEMYFHKQHNNKDLVLETKGDALGSMVLYAIKHRILLPRLLDVYPDLLTSTTSISKIIEYRNELIQRFLYHKQTEAAIYEEGDPKLDAEVPEALTTQQVSVIRSTVQAREEFRGATETEGMNKAVGKRGARTWPTIVLSDSEDEGDVEGGYVIPRRGIIGERSISATCMDGYSNLYNFQRHVGDPILSNSFVQSNQMRRSVSNPHPFSEVVTNSDDCVSPLNLQKNSNDELRNSLNPKQPAQKVKKSNNGQIAKNMSSKKGTRQRGHSSGSIYRTSKAINPHATLTSPNIQPHIDGNGYPLSSAMPKSPRNLSLRDNFPTEIAATNLQVLNDNIMQQNCVVNGNGNGNLHASLAAMKRFLSHPNNNNLATGRIPFAVQDLDKSPSTRNLREDFPSNQVAPHYNVLSEKTGNSASNGNTRIVTSPTSTSVDNAAAFQKGLQFRQILEMAKSPTQTTADPYAFSENEKQIHSNNFGGEIVKSRESAFSFRRQLSQISTGSSTGSVNGDRPATLRPEDYVAEMRIVEELNIPGDFKNFYEYVTKSQITNGNQPISFNMFLELLNAGNLKTYQKKYVEYLKMKDNNIVSNK